MLYWVHTGLYSIQIIIYSYTTIYTRIYCQHTYWYKTLYTLVNAVYLCIYAYIRVHTDKRPYISVWTLYIWVQVSIYAYESFCKNVRGSGRGDSCWHSLAGWHCQGQWHCQAWVTVSYCHGCSLATWLQLQVCPTSHCHSSWHCLSELASELLHRTHEINVLSRN